MSSNTDRFKRVMKTQPGKSMLVGAAVGAGVAVLTPLSLLLGVAVGAVAGAYLGKRKQ